MFWYKITVINEHDPYGFLKSELNDKFFNLYFKFKMPHEMGFFRTSSGDNPSTEVEHIYSGDRNVYYLCLPDELNEILLIFLNRFSPIPCEKPKAENVHHVGNEDFMKLLE